MLQLRCRAVCVELADYLYESQNEVEAAYERESEDFHNKLQRVLQQAAQYYNEGVTDAAVLYPPMQGPPAHDERAAAQAERR